MTNNKFFRKYIKYKQKYIEFKKQIEQYGGNFTEMYEYLLEASDIFKIVQNYGDEDNVKFFIVGSVAVLFYLYDFRMTYENLITKNDVSLLLKYYESILPNDLDIFWTEESYELFHTPINNFTSSEEYKKYTENDKTDVIPSLTKFASSEPGRPPPIMATKTRSKNTDNLECKEHPELFLIKSHYSKIPIPTDPTFYKCNELPSKFAKIDFDRYRQETNLYIMKFNDIDINLIGINELMKSYSVPRDNRDCIKYVFLRNICQKLGKDNKYTGNSS